MDLHGRLLGRQLGEEPFLSRSETLYLAFGILWQGGLYPVQRDCRPVQVFTRYDKPEWEPPVRVALFITCYNDTLFPQTGIATVRLLERLGHTVEFPEDQTCCGQMHSNTGYGDEAIPLIRRFVKAFRDAEVIVSPSSSCVSNIRTAYLRSLADTDDEALKLDVIELVPRVFELSQFLVKSSGSRMSGPIIPAASPTTPPAIRCAR